MTTTHAPTLAADFARLEVLSGSVIKALRRDPMRRAICSAFSDSLAQMGRTVRATQQRLERLERLECLANLLCGYIFTPLARLAYNPNDASFVPFVLVLVN